VIAADADPQRLHEAVDEARDVATGAVVVGDTVDLLDLGAAQVWADRTEKEFGHVDGLIHLVGGWRGSATFQDTDLADWELLEKLLVKTVQHTSLAFHGPLLRSSHGRYVLVSAEGASKPTAGNAAYAAAKSAAEAWTLALADSFRRAGAGGEDGPGAAATVLIVKALVHPEMRAKKPNARFAGFTDVADLAEAAAALWNRPAKEVNGTRQWLTPR
jgi:NAD(P)-dependent dehydrogenase (short-subunit alcohol dehydrogenase family)